jgi:membrane-associated protein
MAGLLDLFLHLDTHLAEITAAYGPWIYGLLFLIVFAETGLVVTPFLPGDSLLFACGALAATDRSMPRCCSSCSARRPSSETS